MLSIHDINTQKSTSIRRAKGVYINNTTATRQPERCIAWHEWPKINVKKPSASVKTTETRPSILCVTHQMSRKKRNYSIGRTVPFEMMNFKWYLMVLGQYMTILAGTWSV